MLLTVSKRLEFSASRRLYDAELSDDENKHRYGDESAARYGTGRNYVAWFVLSGNVDPETGMLVNISEIKDRAKRVLEDRYDHKFLNEDHPRFREVVPTAAAIARELYREIEPHFTEIGATLAAVHLQESGTRSASVFADGTAETSYWTDFSAARQTRSPQLSERENTRLFGDAVNQHGHHYRARFTFRELPTEVQADENLIRIRGEFDHKNLNENVPWLRDRPVTTESLARILLEMAAPLRPHRVYLQERDDFFAEAWNDGQMFLGLREAFSAAHRLHAPSLTAAENRDLFGKCNNPLGHGHTYLAEATLGGDYDEKSGALYDFGEFKQHLKTALDPWRDKHLDEEVPEFQEQSSTGENIVRTLWPKIDRNLDERLVRLRLWETSNNRFTLRRT